MRTELEGMSSVAGLVALRWAVLSRSNSQVGNAPTTKSERVALVLVEARVSARKLAKQELRPRAVRLMPTSRNSPGKAVFPGTLLLLVKVHGSVMFEPFTTAVAVPGKVVRALERWPVASSPTHV